MQREEKSKFQLQDEIIKKLIETNDFEIPKILIEGEENFLTQDAKMRLARSGLNENKQKEELEKAKEEINKEAKRRVKQYLILDSISEKESIRADQSDIDQRMEITAKQMNVPIEKIREYYASRGNLGEMRSQIVAEKTLDLITKKANIKLVDPKTTKEAKEK